MQTRSKGGIALWEIAAAAALVVVIAAIVFPVFARASDPSYKSICQSNLKECAIALQLYWNDYDSRLPSSALVNGSEKWDAPDFLVFGTKLGKLPPRGPSYTWPQILYPYMKNKDVIVCPSDDEVDRHDPDAQVSYRWKVAADKAWYGDGCLKPCQTERDFVYNADQIIFYERKGFHFGDLNGLKNDVQINVAYMDTHVRTISIINGPSGYTSSATALGEPMYYNFDSHRKIGSGNPPGPHIAADYTDPTRYSDRLPY